MRIALLIIWLPFFSFGQNEIFYITAGEKALKGKDYSAYLSNFKTATKLSDYHPWVQSQLAKAYLLNKQENKAIKVLNRLLKMQGGFDLSQDSLFNTLSDAPKYQAIHKKLKQNLFAKINSQLAYQTNEKTLIPEGICYDEVGQTFYLGSIHQKKIIEIDKDGNVSDFCPSGSNGLSGVLGMKVDPIRRHLWVCSPIGPSADSLKGHSGIFKYDLKTKQLIQSYWLKKEGSKNHLFNDIVITPNGDVFFTDSESEAIYTIPQRSDKIELFIASDLLSYVNGIAIDPAGNTIFVSTVGKLYRIELSTKKMKSIKKSKYTFLGGFDGLYWYQDGLVGIQNGFRPTRIVKIKLNKKRNKVLSVSELERNAPHYFVPTTGVIVKDHFYYISNSFLDRYQPKSELKEEEFGPTKVYRIGLIR